MYHQQEYGTAARDRAVTNGKQTVVVCSFEMVPNAVALFSAQIMGREAATKAAYVGMQRGGVKSDGTQAYLIEEPTTIVTVSDQVLRAAALTIAVVGRRVELRVTGPVPAPGARTIEWEGFLNVQMAVYE